MNGNLDGLWEKVNRIAEKGCALASTHGEAIKLIYQKVEDEREAREQAMKEITQSFEKKVDTARNQIVVAVVFVIILGLVLDKILK